MWWLFFGVCCGISAVELGSKSDGFIPLMFLTLILLWVGKKTIANSEDDCK